MNYFIEGLQGSGKSTLLEKLAGRYKTCVVLHEGDYSPVELAWCALVTKEQYSEILDFYKELANLIEKTPFRIFYLGTENIADNWDIR